VISLKIAFRSLLRRKSRMVLIGLLVVFGTLLIVFGQTFTRSAAEASRASIINNFTGDFIVYSARSKEKPSPFAFTTPLPNIQNADAVMSLLSSQPEVEAVVPLAQNYSIIQVQGKAGSVELPFIFYAIQPESYEKAFRNVKLLEGAPLSTGDGILVSQYQNAQYEKKYGIRLTVGQEVTVLGLSEGGGVNAYRTRVRGLFEPLAYKSVFNYINFIDIRTYSGVYNFTGVAAGSLPAELERKLAAASTSEEDVFALAGPDSGQIDTSSLKAESISGYTMIAVKVKDGASAAAVAARIGAQDLGVKYARWDEASGFFARISSALQAFIYLATALIFLVVAFIFMNTLVINIIERTGEIGTMRALGGEKGFVRRIFLAETLMLNVSASAVGILIGLVLILASGSSGLPLPDTISQFLIGGGSLKMLLSPGPFVIALVIVVAVSVIATLFPIRVATRITPLAAMNDR
jgi:putative ABC transport system permease protein